MNNKITSFSKLIFTIIIAIAFFQKGYGQNDKDFEILKNVDIYTSLYRTLNANYVDDIKVSEMMKTGIEAMLKELDPYTVFVSESEIEDIKFITTGEYGGIGSLIQMRNDRVIISEPYENSPAHKAGLKAGDIILKINNQSALGKTVQDVSAMLKGQPGTSIDIEIERPETNKTLNIKVTREKISIPPVSYASVLSNSIGYIKLNAFTQNSYNEVRKAFTSMRDTTQLKGIILDLRDNSGGLLTEAVDIVNLFVDKGEHVVSTKGKQKDKNSSFYTTKTPIDTKIPVVVLVNGRSASASEIVSGAVQDMDRGVIIGRRTFGKGLVQNIFPLEYNTQVKVTVAKYYIPSGRCIQAIDYTHRNKDGNPDIIPDSLINEFKTRNGRKVYDGKGIQPDILSDTVSFNSIIFNLITQNIIFDYATKFAANNATIASPSEFQISDSQYDEFVKFTQNKNLTYKTQMEEVLEDLKKAAEFENSFENISTEYNQLKNIIEQNKNKDLITNKKQIKQLIEQEIISRYYYQKGRIEHFLKDDNDVLKAIDIINNSDKYKEILKKK
ncbi:MAG: S41 family peptidase [Bacteroidales bacterium]